MANGFNFKPGAYQTANTSSPMTGGRPQSAGGAGPQAAGECPTAGHIKDGFGNCCHPGSMCAPGFSIPARCPGVQGCGDENTPGPTRCRDLPEPKRSECERNIERTTGRGRTNVSPHVVPGPETNLNWRGFTPGVMEGFRGFQPWQPMGTNNAFYGPGAAGNLQQLMAPQSGLQPTSIYDVYQSAIPIMQQEAREAIDSSMAQFGAGGTRYGTAAMREAGRIGQETALQQNQLLSNLLYGQGQSDADRALQATQMSMGLGQQLDEGMMNRIRMLQGMGTMEQQRGDQLAQVPFQEFMQSRQGWIPQLLGAAPGGLSPQPGESIVQQEGGGPSTFDYFAALAPMFAMIGMSDKKLKKNIHKVADLPGGIALKSWEWKRGGAPSMGVIAQEVEKKIPGAVIEGKMVDYAKVLGHVMKHANGGCSNCEVA